MATNLTLGTLFTADVNQFLQGIGQIKQAVASLQQTFTQAGQGANAMGTGLASAINKSTTALKAQNAAVKASQAQLSGLAGMWQRVKQAMTTSIAYGTAGAAIYAVIDGLKTGVMAIADYDQALKNLQAITQATDDEMVGLADTMKEVSSKYIYSTKEISDGMVLMGQAGFTATQTMQAMDAAAKLAMGTLEKLDLTVDLVTTTVVSFNMSAVEAGRVADVMANAMNRSKLTLDKLRVAFNYVGSIAHEAGISLEETAAAMSVMSNAGMRASTIGTSLRQVLNNVLAPNRRLRAEFQGLGIELSQLDPKIVGFSGVVQNLRRILVDQKTGLVDVSKAYNLFGLRAAQAATILARSAEDAYPRMLAMMYEVGSASQMADKQMEGLVARFKNVAANAQLIAIAIGEGGVLSVFRLLVDALLLLTKTIKAFVESDAGRLIILFATWTTATAGVIVGLKALIAFIMGPLGLALKNFGVYLLTIVELFNSMQGVSLASKLSSLFAVLTAGTGALWFYAAAAGAVLAALKYWSEAEERQLKTLVRSGNAYKTAADTLDSYQKVLRDMAIRQNKGQDISTEYEASIKRLLTAYPQLSGVIKNNTGAIDENNKVMEEYKQASLDKAFEAETAKLEIYTKQLDASRGSTKLFGEDLSNAFNEGDLRGLIDGLDTTRTTADKIVDSFGNVVEAERGLDEESKKTTAAIQKIDGAFVNMALILKSKGSDVEQIVAKLKEFGATEKQVKIAENAIKSFGDEVSKEADDIRASLANMPHAFAPLFDSLDAMSKVSFAKQVKSMEDEVSQYQKIARTILKTEEDRYAAEAFIRTKHLMKFADDVLKEKVTSEQLLKFKQNLLEEEKKLALERIDKNLAAAKSIYEYEMQAAGDNKRRRDAAEEAWSKAQIEHTRQTMQTIVAIEQGGNAQVVESYKKASDEVIKTGKKMADDYINELDKMVDASKKKIEQLNKARVANEVDLTDKIRNLKQKGMSDSSKFSDDESRVNELLVKAREEGYKSNFDEAKKYYDKASDLSNGLSREIKDSQGETIRTEADTTAKAIGYLETIKSETDALYQKQIEAEKLKMEQAKSLMTELNDLLTTYGGEWDKLNQQKLTAFIESINEIIDRTEALSEATSNVRKDWEVMTKKIREMPKPQQPSLGAKPGLEAVQKPPTGVGQINGVDVNALAGQGGMINGQDVNKLAGQGEGTISFGGKTFDVKQLSDYEGKVKDISERIQTEIKATQDSVVRGAEDSGKQAVDSVGKVGADVTKAITDATDASATSIGTAVESAKTAETSIGDMSTKVSEMSGAALEVNNQFVILGFNVDNVKNRLTELRDLVLEIAAKPLTELITQGALDILTNVKTTLDAIKTNWDSLKSKTITLTINTVGGGGGGSGDSSGSGGFQSALDGGGGGMDNYGGTRDTGDIGEHRLGGLVQALKTAVTFARGGLKLPGYGGGDRVPVMAEAGEFIVNKESTSRFLPIIEAINSNAVSVADFGKRFGGVIRSSMKASVPAFAGGGQIPNRSDNITHLKVKIYPTYMTGDRSSARKMANDISKALEDLKKGRGYSNG